ncbi:lasso peptide biosynthesis B2 protein [Brevundimonas sp.]|uniref:lasso peptide biosynthesis B2 protein n=1 Tax=Brevundimonas sp. TaxID=1871086 RepID=UPI003BA8B603
MDCLSGPSAERDGGSAVSLSPVWLAADVHWAAIDEDAVVLDVAGDAYHCLPGGAALCRSLTDGRPVRRDEIVRGLQNAGLLSATPTVPPIPPPALPTRTIIHEPLRGPLWSDAASALAALWHIHSARRGHGLRPYLDLPSPTAVQADVSRTIVAGGRFWSLLPYLPVEGECLVRSALLMRFLHGLGLKADWVFGVRLNPFTAHCWVQVDGVCLNDDVERLVAYTPIMVR